jgi:hypothetical protein
MSASPSPQKRLSGKELAGLGFVIMFVSIIVSIAAFSQNINEVVWGGIIGFFLGIAVPVFLAVRQHYKRSGHSKVQIKQLSGYNLFLMIGEAKEYVPSQNEELRYSGKQYIYEPYNPPIVYSLSDYLNTKYQNKNIAITGMSGFGKTTLLYHILLHNPNHKIIFVVKGFTDLYSQLPLINGRPAPTLYLRDYAPNVFEDRQSFIASFETAFSPTNQGIIAASIPSLLKQILDEMKTNSWKEFVDVLDLTIRNVDQRTQGIEYQSLLYIRNNIDIVMRDKQYSIKLPPDVVVDFSGLSDQEIGFYGEYLMRQIFNELLSGKRGKTTFFLDEGQVFLDVGSRSIMNKLAALIRATGSFVLSTQMLQTIEGPILSNCATQFSFRLTGSGDLSSLSRIDPTYSWTVSQLAPYTFIDLNQEASHQKVIIFSVMNPNINTMPPILWTPEEEGGMVQKKDLPELNSTAFESELEEYINTRKTPPGIRDISYHFSQKYGWDEKEVQLKLKDNDPESPLHDLIQGGRISSFYFDYAGRPEKLPLKKLYYASGSYQAHDFVRDYIAAIIQKRYPSSPARIESHGESITDIAWEAGDTKYSIEVEMGTKRGAGISETELRIRKYQQDGYSVLVIAPNGTAKNSIIQKYSQLSVNVYTPREFAEKFKGENSAAPTTPPREAQKSKDALWNSPSDTELASGPEEKEEQEDEGGGGDW